MHLLMTLLHRLLFFKHEFVAEEESIVGDPASILNCYQKGEVGTIKEFVVSADQQSKGIGTKTFEEQCKKYLSSQTGNK